MIPGYRASDEVPHPFAQGHSGDLTASGVRQPSFTCGATIDPMLLMGGGHESNSLYTTEDNHYHHQSVVPPTSGRVWMGYPDPAAVSSPISPALGNRVSALARYGVLC